MNANRVLTITFIGAILLSCLLVPGIVTANSDTLQEWFDAQGYTIDVVNDELGIELFPYGECMVTVLNGEHGYDNPTGWYINKSEPYLLFSGRPCIGDNASFTSEEPFGFYIDSDDGSFYTETGLNADVFDHAYVFNNTKGSGYIVAFEDLWKGGDKDYTDRIIEVIIRQSPIANFTYSPSWPQAYESTAFNASSSTPNGGSIVNYEWTFGDGNVTAIGDPIIIHEYLAYGLYNVTLTVTDSEGLNDTAWQMVNVREHPSASFMYTPLEPGTCETITFNASTSEPNGGTIINYRWNFDDGNTTDTDNPVITHHYASSGTYNVTLTVFDSEEKNDTAWQMVTVITHDVAIVDVTPEANWVYQGKPCHSSINVTAANEGEVTETFDVIVYADNDTAIIGDEYIVGTQTITLPNGTSTTLTFLWDTTSVTPCCNYTITAVAITVPHETEIADNTMSSTVTVRVRIVGDVNGDGKVDIKDIAMAAICFGEFPGRPKWLPYGPYADVNNDECVDIRDLVTIAINFGNTC